MVKTRWDPVALDFVEVDGEPSIFRMQRLEPGPPVQFDDESRMRAIVTAVSRLVEADQTLDVQGGKVAKIRTSGDWPPVQCTFPRFSLDAWANRIALSCEDVDLVLANTMMQLGRAADLSLVLPGIIGLFRNPSTQSLPELWKQHMDCKLLDSAEGTLEVLEASHQEQRGVRGSSTGQRLGDHLFSIPGVWPQRTCAHFIELSRNQDPFDLFEAVAAFDRTWRDRNSVKRGTVMGTEWILVTTDGGRFGAVTYTGQSSLTMLQAYSHEQGVRHGYVSNFSNLVADDGSVYDVADCQLFTAEPL